MNYKNITIDILDNYCKVLFSHNAENKKHEHFVFFMLKNILQWYLKNDISLKNPRYAQITISTEKQIQKWFVFFDKIPLLVDDKVEQKKFLQILKIAHGHSIRKPKQKKSWKNFQK